MLTRTALRTFGTLAPRTAAGWFERQILKPRPVRPPHDVPLPEPTARARIATPGGTVRTAAWGAGPTVLLLHGWGGRSESMAPLVQPLVDAGYRVVAWDAPAHGDSEGERTNLVECARATVTIAERYGPVHAVVAHSFGGLTAAYATRIGLSVERMVLLGPPLDIHEQSLAVGRLVGVPEFVMRRATTAIARRLDVNWHEVTTDQLVSRLDAPLLVVHDRADRIVRYEHGAAIAHAAPNGRLMTTEGLGHRGILSDGEVVRAAVAFMAAR